MSPGFCHPGALCERRVRPEGDRPPARRAPGRGRRPLRDRRRSASRRGDRASSGARSSPPPPRSGGRPRSRSASRRVGARTRSAARAGRPRAFEAARVGPAARAPGTTSSTNHASPFQRCVRFTWASSCATRNARSAAGSASVDSQRITRVVGPIPSASAFSRRVRPRVRRTSTSGRGSPSRAASSSTCRTTAGRRTGSSRGLSSGCTTITATPTTTNTGAAASHQRRPNRLASHRQAAHANPSSAARTTSGPSRSKSHVP